MGSIGMPSAEISLGPLAVIANDQEWSLRSMESILTGQGFRVETARNGEEALTVALHHRPHVVILDWQMPELTGLEVCRRLRDDPRVGHSTPVVITTAGSLSRADRLEAYGSGAWEVCVEPLDGEALLLKLQTFVASKLAYDRLRDSTPVYRP